MSFETVKKVRFVDLKKQYEPCIDQIRAEIEEVISTSSFILGPKVKLLEERLSEFSGVKHTLGVSSGTDALTLSLMALEIGPGDLVITTPFTFIATVESILLVGARPLFVDIDPVTFNMNPQRLEQLLQSLKREGKLSKVKAIIPVSLYGQPCDMDEINKSSRKVGIPVIEDACQSFGASYKGRNSCGLSNIGITSFFPTKPLGCFGDAGMIFSDDDSFMERVTVLRDHGQTEKYVHRYVGMNGRMDSLQAAILLAKLPWFSEEINLRRKKADYYSRLLGKSVSIPVVSDDRKSVWALYTIRVTKRSSLIKKLNEKGIDIAVHYPIPIHLQKVMDPFGFKEGDFPESERAAAEVLSLPFHPYITGAEQDYVVEKLLMALSEEEQG